MVGHARQGKVQPRLHSQRRLGGAALGRRGAKCRSGAQLMSFATALPLWLFVGAETVTGAPAVTPLSSEFACTGLPMTTCWFCWKAEMGVLLLLDRITSPVAITMEHRMVTEQATTAATIHIMRPPNRSWSSSSLSRPAPRFLCCGGSSPSRAASMIMRAYRLLMAEILLSATPESPWFSMVWMISLFRLSISSCILRFGPKRRPSRRAMSTSITWPLSQTLSDTVLRSVACLMLAFLGQPTQVHCVMMPSPECHLAHQGMARVRSSLQTRCVSQSAGHPTILVSLSLQQPEEDSGHLPSSQTCDVIDGGLQDTYLLQGLPSLRQRFMQSALGTTS
mmetsp:Transcript_93702/g.279669  ORF Transcript_93702/g.279669 Transcript_93702/m.279669 type:complete len:336 (-) Transcript_93702:205-1212(-)